MLKNLKKLQILWNAARLAGGLYPEVLIKKIPKDLVVEATNACNLRCPVCPTHSSMKRKKGFMDLSLFRSVIDELKNTEEKPRISLNFAGEPLLHRQIAEFVEYGAQNGHRVFISTNATMLTRELSEKLIKAGLDKIHLCIDGITARSHEAYRIGSNFKIVKENIENFIAMKHRLNSQTPFCSIQTLLTSYSEKETDAIIKWAKNTGANSINLKSLHLGEFTSQEIKSEHAWLVPENESFRRKTSSITKTLCRTPLLQTVIYWNGDLGLCCIDYENSIKLSNISESGFIKTLFSHDVIKKKKQGFLKQFKLCKNCPLSNADTMGIDINFDHPVRD